MRVLVKAIILVPIALLAIAFAIGNSNSVTLSFDPFSAAAPSYTVEQPLFIVVFAALIVGVFIGGVATWFGQGRYRRATRLHRREAERLRADLDRMQGTSATSIVQR
jgi:uncharacterized integral membrane protein